MGRNWRHVKTLSRKNCINWRRTWLGSFLELAIPILIMGALCFYKINEQPETVPEEKLLHYASAQYPVTQQVGINFYPVVEQPPELYEFLDFANITDDFIEQDFYQRYPQFFYPQHCYQFTPKRNPLDPNEPQFATKARNVTKIAFIKNTHRIEIEFIDQLRLILKQQYDYAPDMFHQFELVEFENAELLRYYVEHPNYGITDNRPAICFGFEIIKISDSRYELHMHYNDQSHTDEDGAGIPRQLYPSWDPIQNSPDITSFKKYMTNGYAQFQNWVANVILREVTDLEQASIAMVTVPNKSAAFDYDEFMFQVLDQFLPLATLLSFFTPTFRITYRMVSEKETRVRESMTMMGLTQAAYWISWLLYYSIFNLVISSACTFILTYYLLKFTDWEVIFLYFSAFGLAQFGFILFCQGFWQKARHAAIFTVVLYIATASSSIIVTPRDVPNEQKMYASLIPTAVVFNLSKPLAGYESVGIGLNLETAQSLEYHNYIFMDGIKMLLLDFVVYSLLGIYIDNVMPRATGTQRHWFYPCDWLTPTYWDCFNLCRRGDRKSVIEMRQEYQENTFKARKGAFSSKKLIFEQADEQAVDENFETRYIDPDYFEAPDIAQLNLERQNKFLKIEDLRKTFGNGLRAVDGVNVRMYEGQIFALLGHNGAGKTTTISMLTGMLRPSAGFATVYGYDVFQYDLDDVRRFMGVCPQHDILFDLLTPWEHLSVFQDFKGSEKTKQQKRAEIEKLLKDVGIWDMRNTKAKNLSGGSKRKLSVAIALCGDSKFVMLDEPTSGMDLQARRSLWNMLRAYRNNRIIILTTHYMDEADVLGDRIGIMAQGKLVCLGASLFLKKRYGVGYNLTLEKTDQFANESIEPYLQTHLGEEVHLLSEIAREITFQIPVEYAPQFKDFFHEFDQKIGSLGVASYGISITTLEEVFLAVGDGRDFKEHAEERDAVRKKILNYNQGLDLDDLDEAALEGAQEDDENLIEGKVQLSKQELQRRRREKRLEDYTIADQLRLCACCLHILALCIKRCTMMFRGWRGMLFEIIAPVLFVTAGFSIIKLTFLYESPERELSTRIFPLPQEILVNSEPVMNEGTDGSKFKNNTKELIDFLPASYTLLTDFDFEVQYRNYTEDLYRDKAAFVTGWREPIFDMFEQFDEDHFEERRRMPYRYGSYLVYQANNVTKNFKVINYVNTTSQDVGIAYPQFMYEAALRAATGIDHFQYKVITKPFPILQKYKDQEKETSVISLLFVISVGVSLLPGLIVGAVMHEREKNLKHMQIISGMNLCSYWIVNLLFDILKMEVPMIICCVLLYSFEMQEYLPAMFVFMAYPIGVVPFTHATSFLFQQEWSAQFFTVGLNLVVMIFGPLTVYIFMFNSSTQADVYFGNELNYWLRVIPSYNVSKTFLFLGTRKILQRKMNDPILNYPQDIDLDPWSRNNLEGDLVALMAHSVIGCAMIIFFEAIIYRNCWARCFYALFQCCFRATSRQIEDAYGSVPEDNPDVEVKDDDVFEEEKRVGGTKANDMPVRVARLKKVFKTGFCRNLTAVNNVSFGLETGECFALLGVNGAGKTTVFKSLTNDTVPTGGRVSIGGWDVQRWFGFARKRIGYCPQHNTIFEQLTVIENLYLFARIKGVKWTVRKSLVNRTIDKLNLDQHKYKEAGTLSGGNKRKLQLAIAIIGNPPIMLLDEPSSGMDPEARRFMWQVVAGFTQKRKQCAVILTTHSMEEAEALSTKMGIMVKGGIFKCFGSVQHIKNKFGTGYELELKIRRPTPADIQAIMTEYELPTNYAKMSIPMFKEYLSYKQFPEWLTMEISSGGLGDELLREAKSNKQGLVRILHLIEWLHVIQNALKIVKTLAYEFGTVEILNHHNSSFKFRVLRHDKSIGFLFGLMETRKEEFAISEYSASQTTLEQIFQMFAHMSYDDDALHLVFRYNEDYEDDLEIHKSTTIQSLYTRKPNLIAPDSVEDDENDDSKAADNSKVDQSKLDVQGEQKGHNGTEGKSEIEMQDMGQGLVNDDKVLYTQPDATEYAGTSTNMLLGSSQPIVLPQLKPDEEPAVGPQDNDITIKDETNNQIVEDQQPSRLLIQQPAAEQQIEEESPSLHKQPQSLQPSEQALETQKSVELPGRQVDDQPQQEEQVSHSVVPSVAQEVPLDLGREGFQREHMDVPSIEDESSLDDATAGDAPEMVDAPLEQTTEVVFAAATEAEVEAEEEQKVREVQSSPSYNMESRLAEVPAPPSRQKFKEMPGKVEAEQEQVSPEAMSSRQNPAFQLSIEPKDVEQAKVEGSDSPGEPLGSFRLDDDDDSDVGM